MQKSAWQTQLPTCNMSCMIVVHVYVLAISATLESQPKKRSAQYKVMHMCWLACMHLTALPVHYRRPVQNWYMYSFLLSSRCVMYLHQLWLDLRPFYEVPTIYKRYDRKPTECYTCKASRSSPWMLIICPNFSAAPRTRHSVETSRLMFASVRNGLDADKPPEQTTNTERTYLSPG